jgi:hypothetical protein
MLAQFSIQTPLFLALLAGCGEVPEVSWICADMCDHATDLYGTCLDDWGLDWTAAGHEDADAHLESCEVWSWEQSLLHGTKKVNAVCTERASIFHHGDCSDYSDIDWNEEL